MTGSWLSRVKHHFVSLVRLYWTFGYLEFAGEGCHPIRALAKDPLWAQPWPKSSRRRQRDTDLLIDWHPIWPSYVNGVRVIVPRRSHLRQTLPQLNEKIQFNEEKKGSGTNLLRATFCAYTEHQFIRTIASITTPPILYNKTWGCNRFLWTQHFPHITFLIFLILPLYNITEAVSSYCDSTIRSPAHPLSR